MAHSSQCGNGTLLQWLLGIGREGGEKSEGQCATPPESVTCVMAPDLRYSRSVHKTCAGIANFLSSVEHTCITATYSIQASQLSI